MTLKFAMADISPVTERLWTGGDFESESHLGVAQVMEAAAAGLTHIVDLRREVDDSRFVGRVAAGLVSTWMGIDDTGQMVSDAWWDHATEVVCRALEIPQGGVLVRCHLGVNRGPSLAFAALLRLCFSPVSALDAIRRVRSTAFMLYAEGALCWWLRRNAASERESAEAFARTEAWRADHPLRLHQAILAASAQRKAIAWLSENPSIRCS